MSQWFEEKANAGIDIVREVYGERGKQYGDSWATCRWQLMGAVIGEICPAALTMTVEELRIVALAAYIDMKHERCAHMVKADSLVDMTAYTLALTKALSEWREGNDDPVTGG